jgi:hypothetical protein
LHILPVKILLQYLFKITDVAVSLDGEKNWRKT